MNSYVIPDTTVVDNVCHRLGQTMIFLRIFRLPPPTKRKYIKKKKTIMYAEYFNDLIIL